MTKICSTGFWKLGLTTKTKRKYWKPKEREKEKSGKPPVCLRKLIRPGDGKTRKKEVPDTVFGMYQNIFPIMLGDVLI